jgi:capsular polysaccharide biosynthesis protein
MQENDGFDFDLGRYIEILIRQWRLIAAAIMVCILAAAIFSLRKPFSYESRVVVSTIKLGSTATFGSTIETLSEGQEYTNLVDRRARLQSFIGLVKNPLIAQRVYEDLVVDFGDKVPVPGTLLEMVSASLVAGSDSIEIVAKNGSPELALAIANVWGQRYVEYINELYSTGGALSTTSNIRAQIDETYQKYLFAQEAYETFLSSSPMNEFSRLAGEYLRVGQVLEDARSLREQVIAGGGEAAASNALVVSLLKTQAFAAAPGLENYQVQIVPVASSPEEMGEEVDKLIVALEDRFRNLEGRSEALMESAHIAAGVSDNTLASSLSQAQAQAPRREISSDEISLSRAEQQNRILLAQVEKEKGLLHERQLDRDLAWETYSNLATKEVELTVTAQTGGQEVVLGAPAIESEKVSNVLQPVVLAAIVGVVVGVFAAFGIEYWWGYKGIEAQPILLVGGWKRGA